MKKYNNISKKIFTYLLAFSIIISVLPHNNVLAAENSVLIDEMADNTLAVSCVGYEYKTFSAPKFGDRTRAVITNNGLGEIVYEIKDYEKIDVVLYRNSQGGDLLLYTSENNDDNFLKPEDGLVSENVTDRSAGWEKVIYTVNNVGNAAYLKIKWYDPDLSANLHAQRYMGIYGTSTDYFKSQIGAVIRYPHFTDTVTQKIQMDVGNCVFNDDFNNLNSWEISNIYSDMIKTDKIDNRSCLVIDSKKHTDNNADDPYIKTVGFNAEYSTYTLRFSVKFDSDDVWRIFSLKTGSGDFLYPVVFTDNGVVGAKKNDGELIKFKYDYMPDTWYDVKCVIDTEDCIETVYINNEKLTDSPLKLLDGGSSGGISELRVSQQNMGTNGSVSYIDSISAERAYNFYIAEKSADSASSKKITELNDIYFHWAGDDIKKIVSYGIMQGSGNKKFMPDNYITVSEFIKTAVSSLGIKPDEGTLWYEKYISYALENGYVLQNEFNDYGRPIKRVEMARIISRITSKESAANDGYDYSTQISDYNLISESDKTAVTDVYSKGIMTGDANKCFAPQNFATRAEAACVIRRIVDPYSRRYSRYTVGIYTSEEYKNAADNISNVLKSNGIICRFLSKENMKNEDVFNADSLDCIILMNNIESDAESVDVLREFVEDGGDIVLAGKDIRNSLSDKSFQIPVFGNGTSIKSYLMEDIAEIRASDESGQDIISNDFKMDADSWSGEKAISFDTVFRSKSIPVLKAYDSYGRELGYAAGVLVNYGTSYEDSNMLYYGIDQKDFYESTGFAQSAAQVILKFSTGELENRWSYEEEYKKNYDAVMSYEMTQPAPNGRVHVSDDGSHLVDGDGNDLFLNGANVLGDFSFTYNGSSRGYGQFCIEEAEASFKNMSELGINYIRLWNTGVDEYGGEYARQVIKIVKDLCRKYKIYVELVGTTDGVRVEKQSIGAVTARMDEQMKMWAGEPMLLAYDYANEPDLVEMIYQFGIYGDAPLDKYDIYGEYKDILEGLSSWNTYYNNKGGRMANIKNIADENRFKQVAALFTLFMADDKRFVTGTNKLYNGHLDGVKWMASDDELFSKAMNEIISNGLSVIKDRLKSWDPGCLFTIGFDSAFCVVPAFAEYVDIWNQHVYRATDPPYPMSKTVKQFTSYDTIASLSAKIPSMYGEFSPAVGTVYAFGSDTRKLTEETADAINLFTILYPYSKGYGGTNIWQYEQRAPYRIGWLSESTANLYGIERFSGNSDPMYRHMDRMIGYEMRFIKKLLNRKDTFGTGSMEWFEADTQCATGFKFTAQNVEYVYSDKYCDSILSFDNSDKSYCPVVMLDWNDGKLEVMATDNVTVKIDLTKCLSLDSYDNININGFYKEYKTDNGILEISLLNNSVVSVTNG